MIIHGHTIRLVPRRPRDGPRQALKKFVPTSIYYKLIQKTQVKASLIALNIARFRSLWRADRLPWSLAFWIIAVLAVGCWAVVITLFSVVSTWR